MANNPPQGPQAGDLPDLLGRDGLKRVQQIYAASCSTPHQAGRAPGFAQGVQWYITTWVSALANGAQIDHPEVQAVAAGVLIGAEKQRVVTTEAYEKQIATMQAAHASQLKWARRWKWLVAPLVAAGSVMGTLGYENAKVDAKAQALANQRLSDEQLAIQQNAKGYLAIATNSAGYVRGNKDASAKGETITVYVAVNKSNVECFYPTASAWKNDIGGVALMSPAQTNPHATEIASRSPFIAAQTAQWDKEGRLTFNKQIFPVPASMPAKWQALSNTDKQVYPELLTRKCDCR